MNINTGNIYHQDKFRDTPRAQWSALLRERRMYIETQFEYDCRCIVQYLDEAEDVYAELGYDSADEMIQQELLIKPEWVRIAVTWLNQEQPTVRLVADMAVVASKLRQHLTQQQLLGLINLLAPPQP